MADKDVRFPNLESIKFSLKWTFLGGEEGVGVKTLKFS